jgi:hypothetical protein
VRLAYVFLTDISPYPVLSAIVSQVFSRRDHLQICGGQNFDSALGKYDVIAGDRWGSMQDTCAKISLFTIFFNIHTCLLTDDRALNEHDRVYLSNLLIPMNELYYVFISSKMLKIRYRTCCFLCCYVTIDSVVQSISRIVCNQ